MAENNENVGQFEVSEDTGLNKGVQVNFMNQIIQDHLCPFKKNNPQRICRLIGTSSRIPVARIFTKQINIDSSEKAMDKTCEVIYKKNWKRDDVPNEGKIPQVFKNIFYYCRQSFAYLRCLSRELMRSLLHFHLKRISFPILDRQVKAVADMFGSNFASFFIFCHQNILYNLFLGLLWLFLVIIPQAIYFDYKKLYGYNFSPHNILDGENILGETWLFYGGFTAKVNNGYPIALVYLLMIFVTFYGSMFHIVRRVTFAYEPNNDHQAEKTFPFSLAVFSFWDFSYGNTSSQTRSIASCLRDYLAEENIKKARKKRTTTKKKDIVLTRGLAWLFTILVIASACAIVFYLSFELRSWHHENSENSNSENSIKQTVIHYIPAVGFSLINFLTPMLLEKITKLEDYASGRGELKVTLGRIFILHLANLLSLAASLIITVRSDEFKGCAGTYIGQQLYKQIIMDTLVEIVMLVLKASVYYLWKGVKINFVIKDCIMATLSRQAFIWMGSAVCPILPLVGTLCLWIMFETNYYVAKYGCNTNIKRWNRQLTTFYWILLMCSLSFLLLPVSIIIYSNQYLNLGEKNGCGPFGIALPLSVVTEFIKNLPYWEKYTLKFLISASVLIPVIIVLMCVIYVQSLRMRIMKQKKKIRMAQLCQEREENREMKVHLNTMIKDLKKYL